MLTLGIDISKEAANRSLFDQISQMCSARILHRLRSKHAVATLRKKDKAPLSKLLGEALAHPQLRTKIKDPDTKAKLGRMRDHHQKLGRCFQDLEESTTRESKLQGVKKVVSLTHEIDVLALIRILSGCNRLNVSLRDYLPRAVEKLGRYRAVALNLSNAARTIDHSLFQRITVLPVQPLLPSLQQSTLTKSLQDSVISWGRLTGHFDESTKLRHIAKQKFQRHVWECQTKWKIHAELQLLFFYEQSSELPRPRAICASKSACYLCSLFLEIHGLYIVPSSHGRIYDRWTLPSHNTLAPKTRQNMLPIITRLNEHLENTIRMATRGEINRRPPPNESVVMLYDPWSSQSTVRPQRPAVLACVHGKDLPAVSAGSCSQPLKRPYNERSSLSALSSAVSIAVRSGSDQRKRCLQRGEHARERVQRGDFVVIQTYAIHFEISWSIDESNKELEFRNASDNYLVDVEYLSQDSEIVVGARIVDVDGLRGDHDEVIAMAQPLTTARLVCCSGEHRVLVAVQKVPGRMAGS